MGKWPARRDRGINLIKPSVSGFELSLEEVKRWEYLEWKGRLSREWAIEMERAGRGIGEVCAGEGEAFGLVRANASC